MPSKEKTSKSEVSKEMRNGKTSQERSAAAKEVASGNKGKTHNVNSNKSH